MKTMKKVTTRKMRMACSPLSYPLFQNRSVRRLRNSDTVNLAIHMLARVSYTGT